MKKNASVVCAKCAKYKKTFGVRAEKRENGWFFTWAFPMNDEVAAREGYTDTKLEGGFSHDEEYPGCPYCHAAVLVQCGGCNKLGCYDTISKDYTCPSCGNKSQVITASWNAVDGGGY